MKKFKIMRWSIFTVLLFLLSNLALAVESPITLLENVSGQMVSYLKKHQSQLKHNKKIIFNIVDQVLVPYVDKDRMAGLVVGRNNWQKATPAQRQTFVDEFKHLVVSTYAGALSSFDDDQVQFYPFRGDYTNRRTVQVNSVVVRKSGQKIPISYNLIRSGESWKVYDFSVENVSIVQNYRSQFAGPLARGGIPALLQQMRQRSGR